MTRVFTIGETFYDITFSEKVPTFANPGGAMLNTAVSLARCGIDATLISEFSTDHLGNKTNNFLNSNGVNTERILQWLERTQYLGPILMAMYQIPPNLSNTLEH